MEDYIEIPTTEVDNNIEDYIKLRTETPKRIQIIYELSTHPIKIVFFTRSPLYHKSL